MNNNERLHTVGGIKFTFEELDKQQQKDEIFLIRYRTVYQLNYSENAGFYGLKIYYKQNINNSLPLTKKGRFIFANAEFLNRLVGQEIVFQ